MNAVFMNIADLKDPHNKQGRSYREVNNNTKHKFKKHDLVELDNGIRLFIHDLTRDCDGTPLYTLAPDSDHNNKFGLNYGYSEEGMFLIQQP